MSTTRNSPSRGCNCGSNVSRTSRSSIPALDGFSNPDGDLNPDLPRGRIELTFSDEGEHTLVETLVSYDSPEDLQKVIDMGMEEGLASTLERLDELLLELD